MLNFGFAFWMSFVLLLSVSVPLNAEPSAATPEHMLVTVEPSHGANVPAIHREDVMVRQGRERAKVTGWVPAQGDRGGLELFVLIDDASGTSLGSQLEDIRKFIMGLPETAKVGVAYMQYGVAQVSQNLTNNHSLAAKALRLPMGFSGINASPYFSLEDLIKRWPESTARREVLMVSDGIDRLRGSFIDDPYLDTAIERAQRAGVVVFAIYTPGVGHYRHSFWRTWLGQIYLSRLGDETGGEAYYIGFIGPAVSFAPYLDDVAKKLTEQYWLTFLAQRQRKAGMQNVKLSTELPNADLVSADSVWVPATP